MTQSPDRVATTFTTREQMDSPKPNGAVVAGVEFPKMSVPMRFASKSPEPVPEETEEAALTDRSLPVTLKHANNAPLGKEPVVTAEAEDLMDLRNGYPDLELLASIKISKHREVYRAVSKKYGACIVKTTTSMPTLIEVELLRNEFGKLRMCSSENIASVYDLYERELSLGIALVTNDCGTSLRSWADSLPIPPSLETVLDIGIQIADGLDNLHRGARLIHSDINPNNVCYDEATKIARIIDLGAAHGFLEPFSTL
jgi:serine/threonine protein kinase